MANTSGIVARRRAIKTRAHIIRASDGTFVRQVQQVLATNSLKSSAACTILSQQLLSLQIHIWELLQKSGNLLNFTHMRPEGFWHTGNRDPWLIRDRSHLFIISGLKSDYMKVIPLTKSSGRILKTHCDIVVSLFTEFRIALVWECHLRIAGECVRKILERNRADVVGVSVVNTG